MPDRTPASSTRSVLSVHGRPALLSIAVAIVGVEALVLLVWAVLVLVRVSTMSVTSALFFLIYAAALVLCGYGILGLHSWARSPIVLTQLMMLGLAWDARYTVVVAVPMAVVALATLGCLFSSGALAALSAHED